VTISSLDGYLASVRQALQMTKTGAHTTVSTAWFTPFADSGVPGAGTLAIGNTANGVVPTDATAGYPSINAFQSGAKGYLSRLEYFNTVASRLAIYDRLFAAGAYAFNAAVTLASQPSYSSRVPGGTDFTGLEIWMEQVTAATGIQNVAVTYTNENGVTGRTTGTIAMAAAGTVGRMMPLPLQAGDSGVQKIESVTGSVATVGTFNVMVLRPLVQVRVPVINGGGILDMLSTGMPEVFADSALYLMINSDGTSGGLPDLSAEIANG
jgi:hypothetical protein